jgi:hypothetical protein
MRLLLEKRWFRFSKADYINYIWEKWRKISVFVKVDLLQKVFVKERKKSKKKYLHFESLHVTKVFSNMFCFLSAFSVLYCSTTFHNLEMIKNSFFYITRLLLLFGNSNLFRHVNNLITLDRYLSTLFKMKSRRA